jgi:hypothetical protein
MPYKYLFPTSETLKGAVFWDVRPRSLVEAWKLFNRMYCSNVQARAREQQAENCISYLFACSAYICYPKDGRSYPYETSVNLDQTTRRHHSTLHSRRRENPRSHINSLLMPFLHS